MAKMVWEGERGSTAPKEKSGAPRKILDTPLGKMQK